jgi:phage terminase small subunit
MTPKQEAFARAYVETGNASEAYRRSYNAGKMKPEAIKVNACKLLKDANVALTVERLQLKHQKRHDVTVDSITEMLKADRELARRNAQSGAAVTAAMGLAKLHGLIVEKREVTHKQGVEDLSDAELGNIARGSGNGAAEAAPRPPRAN